MSEIMQSASRNFVTLAVPFQINTDFTAYCENWSGYGNNIDQMLQYFPFFASNQGFK